MAEAAPTLDLESEYPPLDPVSDSLMDNVTDDAQLKMSVSHLISQMLPLFLACLFSQHFKFLLSTFVPKSLFHYASILPIVGS